MKLRKSDHYPRELSYPLPHRCSHKTENGYVTCPWTPDDLKLAHQAGGWENGTQDIESRGAK